MTEIVVAQRMWQRRGTTAEWAAANPVLAQGEIGVETFAPGVPVKMKIGDGVTIWSLLAYQGVVGGITPAMRYFAETSATVDADPGTASLRWNNSTQWSSTMLFLDDTLADSTSIEAMWPVIEKGGFIYIQHKLDEARWQIWQIISVTDAAGYVKLGVLHVAHLGTFLDGDPIMVTIENGPGDDTGTQMLAGLTNTYIGSGTGSPEGVITASVGALYTRLDGGLGSTLYSKEVGTGNTGWVAHRGSTPSRNLGPGTVYVLTAADVGYRLNNESVRAVHLPETAAAGLRVNDTIEVRQSDPAAVQFNPEGLVVMEYDDTLFAPETRYKGAVVEVKVIATNRYSLTGALADA